MIRLFIIATALVLSGCASTGDWRALNIDGTNEATYGESLARLNNELPYFRSQLLALALVDIANTRNATATETNDGPSTYSEDDLRRELNGLTYEEVIALADQSGPSIRTLYYYSRGWGNAFADVNRQMTLQDRPFYPPSPPMFRDTNSGYVWPNN